MDEKKDWFNISSKRKISIFRALSAGPTLLDYLFHPEFFRNEEGKLVCRRVFNRVMKKLADDGYIDIHEWRESLSRKGIVRFGILKERGADFLCLHSDLERGHIRTKLPQKSHIRHELTLSKVIREIRYAEKSKKISTIGYLYDDVEMKRLDRDKKKRAKGRYFPDLKVQLFHEHGNIELNIELDTGNKTAAYWVKKIGSWGDPTLLITLHPARARKMLIYALNAKSQFYLAGSIGVTTLDDFYKAGIASWIPLLINPGERRVIRFREY